MLVVDDRCLVDLTCTLCPALCLNNEEVFQWLALVVACAKVGEVITELHRLLVELAVGPTSQHRYLGGRVCVTVVTVTCVLEVLECDYVVGLCSVDVG